MANLNTLTNNDEYYTPIEIWQNILHFLPQDKTYIEPFYGDGNSINNLRSLGLDVVGGDADYIDLLDNLEYDIIISNPSFSKKIFQELLFNLDAINKPFVLILPISKIFSKYFRNSFRKHKEIQIIIPRNRMSFIDPFNSNRNKPSFESAYICYKMGLEKDITWL